MNRASREIDRVNAAELLTYIRTAGMDELRRMSETQVYDNAIWSRRLAAMILQVRVAAVWGFIVGFSCGVMATLWVFGSTS